MKQQYKIRSKGSSHKGDIAYYVGGFQYNGEPYYTLKLHNKGFRSYPLRNLELQDNDEAMYTKLGKLFIKFLKKEFRK